MDTVHPHLFKHHGFEYKFIPWNPASKRLLVLLHGTGGDESSLLELGRTVEPNAALLAPRGTSTEEGVNRFFRRFDEGVFDENDIIEKSHLLSKFLAQVIDHHGFEEVIGIGYSNGANMALALLLLHPDLFDGVIAWRATLPLVPATPPNLNGKRALVLSGTSDPMMPHDGVNALTQHLAEYGAKVQHNWLQTGHNLVRADIELASSWLASPV